MCTHHLIVHGFTHVEYSVLEDDRLETRLRVNVKGISAGFTNDFEFTGRVISLQGTASKRRVA